jgi:hypothetical protein
LACGKGRETSSRTPLKPDYEVEVRQAVWSAAIHRRFDDRILSGSGSLLPGMEQADFWLCSQAARWIMAASRPVRQQVAL